MKWRELNLRDLGGIPFSGGVVPQGLFLRSGKLSVLKEEECEALCRKYHIGCVIDVDVVCASCSGQAHHAET